MLADNRSFHSWTEAVTETPAPNFRQILEQRKAEVRRWQRRYFRLFLLAMCVWLVMAVPAFLGYAMPRWAFEVGFAVFAGCLLVAHAISFIYAYHLTKIPRPPKVCNPRDWE